MVNPDLIAIAPHRNPLFEKAIAAAGGVPCDIGPEVGGLVWTDYHNPQELKTVLAANPQLTWVQLPWAGVDAFADLLKHPVRFTSAKGSYREPVAEHALMLAMALGRELPERIRATTWGEKFAVSLYDSNVVVVGGGGIAEEFIALTRPMRTRVTVVRRQIGALEGADKTVTFDQLDSVLAEAQFVILACALTEETRGLFDSRRLALMNPNAYLVNVARGPIVVTEDLLDALDAGVLAGAGIDVTDPEPLPQGHRAWGNPRLIITPHTADTPPQVEHFLALRIGANALAYLGQGPWIGQVDPVAGY